MSQKLCSYARNTEDILLYCFSLTFSRSVNAACSGMLVQSGFIPRFCCNKYLGCLSYSIAFKAYHRENTRQVSLEIKSCTFN